MHETEYKTIFVTNESYEPLRGCTHGCIYCDSRSTCYQMDHDFEEIEVKKDALTILEAQPAPQPKTLYDFDRCDV